MIGVFDPTFFSVNSFDPREKVSAGLTFYLRDITMTLVWAYAWR